VQAVGAGEPHEDVRAVAAVEVVALAGADQLVRVAIPDHELGRRDRREATVPANKASTHVRVPGPMERKTLSSAPGAI
jgi:hypothetical protein